MEIATGIVMGVALTKAYSLVSYYLGSSDPVIENQKKVHQTVMKEIKDCSDNVQKKQEDQAIPAPRTQDFMNEIVLARQKLRHVSNNDKPKQEEDPVLKVINERRRAIADE